ERAARSPQRKCSKCKTSTRKPGEYLANWCSACGSPHVRAKARTSAGRPRMCSGFQAGSDRCRGPPRAEAGDARLTVASNPMAIGASFIIRLLAVRIYPEMLTRALHGRNAQLAHSAD